MKKSYTIKIIAAIILLMTGAIFYFIISSSVPKENIKRVTFNKLKKIRQNKKEIIINYFNEIACDADNLKKDDIMNSFFFKLQNNKTLNKYNLELKIDKHYIKYYNKFYDILFIDKSGYVFHSIKKESDYKKYLFEGELAKTQLSKVLKNNKNKQFVSFEFYLPSDEPAAFYIVPVAKNNYHHGWFVLQCPINNINKILTDEKPGRTGEIYLVNEKKLMLSESRFIKDSTILKQKIDTIAVKNAIETSVNEKIIKDYRGVTVYSSYEKFNVFGASWIIIAEIDEDEVITEYYKKYKKYFQKKICDYLSKKNHSIDRGTLENYIKYKRIDMNEFAKSKPGDILKTVGVTTCTSLIISLPNRFGYMAHISPMDEIYTGIGTRLILNEKSEDFTGKILNRIKYYDVYPYELKKLKISIIAPHKKSFNKVVDKILENGIELANIKFVYNPKMNGANVLLNIEKNNIKVEWFSKNSRYSENSSDYEDLGTIVKKLLNIRNK